jgi:tetratricopeptide (TPR) repeat protein
MRFVSLSALVVVFFGSSFAFGSGDSSVLEQQLPQSRNLVTLDKVKALIDSQKYGEALQVLNSEAGISESAELLNLQGFALRKMGKNKEAISSYQKALKLKPDFPQAKEYLGVAFLNSKNISEAQSIYSELKKTSPEYAKMLEQEAKKLKINLK